METETRELSVTVLDIPWQLPLRCMASAIRQKYGLMFRCVKTGDSLNIVFTWHGTQTLFPNYTCTWHELFPAHDPDWELQMLQMLLTQPENVMEDADGKLWPRSCT